jgi:hypothetical protein
LGHTITMEEFLRTMSIFWTKKLWHTRGWLCLKLQEFLHLESHTTVVLFMQSIFEEKNRISEYFHKTKPSMETQNNNTVSGQRKPISCFIYRLCPMSTSCCQWWTYSFTKMTVMWDITLCSVVELDQHLRGAYCLHHQGKDGGSTHLWNIGLLNKTTWCHVPKGCHLYTCCCENLKSHSLTILLYWIMWTHEKWQSTLALRTQWGRSY